MLIRGDFQMQRAEVLSSAQQAVADRGLNYGAPEDNFERIMRLWNAHLRNRGLLAHSYGVCEGDVAIMLGLVKDARLANDMTHADSWIDKAGYAACGGEVSKAGAEVIDGPWPANATRGNRLGLIELSAGQLAGAHEKGEDKFVCTRRHALDCCRLPGRGVRRRPARLC